jgi:hypothetical protein
MCVASCVGRRWRLWATFFALGCCQQSQAHAFAAPYTLPVPFWLYAYGSAVALLVSFVFFAVFSSTRLSNEVLSAPSDRERRRGSGWIVWPALVVTLECLSCAVLTVAIVCGFIGSPNAMLNFNMTWFWIIFLLLLVYASSIAGDFYQVISPWRMFDRLLGTFDLRRPAGYFKYPAYFGYFPAVIFYFLLISAELFGTGSPEKLSLFLLSYFCWMLIGSCLFGFSVWATYADVFGVTFSLIGMLAPIDWVSDGGNWRMRFRVPLSGIRSADTASLSLTCFIIFMLSSTAFDGIHDTLLWNSGYWKDVYPLVRLVIQSHTRDMNEAAAQIYYLWQWLCLALSPVVYLAAYAAVLALGKLIVGSRKSNRQLVSDFAWSLVPIAFFYNVTHYFTVALSQSPQIVKLASDPLGRHWNLFGTATETIQPFMLDAGVVWHVQVALILAGHVLGVYIAHAQSFRSFESRAKALFSQIPMMALMVMLTASGLWILSLPMNSA